MPEEVGSEGAVKRTETMVYASRAESKANDLQGIQEMAQVTGGEVMPRAAPRWLSSESYVGGRTTVFTYATGISHSKKTYTGRWFGNLTQFKLRRKK